MTESPETPLSDPVPGEPAAPEAPEAPTAPDEGGDEGGGEESADE
jgi:hypothetical protein